jgi:BirA family biotin operon repressor/biotin-[acetyl-CoA-carboxylase] ligase
MSDAKNRLVDKETAIKDNLQKKEIQIPVIYHSQTSSTMDDAKEYLKKKSEIAALFMADIQSAGRGRQMREWESLPGNLFATFSLQTKLEVNKLSGFSLVAGLACSSTLGNLGCRTRLKWPNDLLTLGGKKLGGILVEIIQENSETYILCGIGINLIAHPKDVENTSNLKEVTGTEYTSVQVISRITPVLKSYFDKFSSGGFPVFRNEWNQNAALIGREIKVHISKDKTVSGMLMGVSSDGSLQIEKNGKIDTLTAGDISLNE